MAVRFVREKRLISLSIICLIVGLITLLLGINFFVYEDSPEVADALFIWAGIMFFMSFGLWKIRRDEYGLYLKLSKNQKKTRIKQ